jgi:drug/metabolite transporter (DMT)-like permease
LCFYSHPSLQQYVPNMRRAYDHDYALGLVACVVSAACFGSMFLPIKRRRLGNGMLVQWLQCAAILLCAGVVLVVRMFPPFSILAVFAGCIWACGEK